MFEISFLAVDLAFTVIWMLIRAAAVDANGNITAIAKGTANIYAYTQSGVRVKIVVTVK